MGKVIMFGVAPLLTAPLRKNLTVAKVNSTPVGTLQKVQVSQLSAKTG